MDGTRTSASFNSAMLQASHKISRTLQKIFGRDIRRKVIEVLRHAAGLGSIGYQLNDCEQTPAN